MPEFTYKAKKKTGEVYEEVINAPDRFSVYTKVRKSGDTIISVDKKRKRSFLSLLQMLNSITSTIKVSDKVMLARNLGTMVKAGLPLSRALAVMGRQVKNKKLKNVMGILERDISKGTSLHEAMNKIKDVFPPLFIAMVRAGEESGKLAEAFEVIAYQLDRSYQLRKKIKGALIYPAIIVIAMIIIGILMLVYVVPTLTQTFAELEIELPTSTQAVILVSNLLTNHTILILIGFIALAALVVAGLRTTQGKRISDFLVLHIPPIGSIAREVNTARTTRTLASLLSAGVELVGAIEITHDVVQNSYYRKILDTAAHDVQQGKSISEAFSRDDGLYPALVGEMIAVGEETGQLASMLEQVATFYEDEIEQQTKNLSTIIEPILMLVIGVVVGFFALSMIAPIYSLSEGI